MKKTVITLLTVLAAALQGWACTSIIVGPKASTDGSVMCTYNCDSFGTFHPLYHYSAATHRPGEMRKVIDRDTRVYHGDIPEAPVTYNVMGDVNEYQVNISETTFGGRKEMIDTTGILDYGSLMCIALQRSKTAREAIDVMTSLAAKYGFCSSGETFSVCDPGEAWIMEMMGCGPGSKNVVWVAIRIPDNAVCAHANQSRITTFDRNDKNNVLYSANVVSYARSMGWYDGKDEDFSFCDTYDEPDFGGRRACDARVWAVFNKFKDGCERYLPYVKGMEPLDKVERMPLWIVPDSKVSLQDVLACLRDHYEGTDLAMDNDPGMGLYDSPFRPTPLRYKIGDKEYFNERPIATMQTAFTWVSQLRGWMPREVGALLWWANDDGDVAAYTPINGSSTRIPYAYNTPGADAFTFNPDNAYWLENMVGNMVYPRYSMLYPSLKTVRDSLENSFFHNQPLIEAQAMELLKTNRQAAIDMLNDYSIAQVDNMMVAWKKLAAYLIVKFNDGIIKEEENGQFLRSKGDFRPVVTRPGYTEKAKQQIANSPAATRLQSPQ